MISRLPPRVDGRVYRLGDPGQGVLDQAGVAHVLVVFQVIQDHQVRAVASVLEAPQALARAPGQQAHVRAGDEITSRALYLRELAEVLGQALVVAQLQADVAGEVLGQVGGVRAQHHEAPQAEEHLLQHIAEADHRGLGEAARRGHGHGPHGRTPGRDQLDEFVVERREVIAEIVWQIRLAKVERVLPGHFQALRAGRRVRAKGPHLVAQAADDLGGPALEAAAGDALVGHGLRPRPANAGKRRPAGRPARPCGPRRPPRPGRSWPGARPPPRRRPGGRIPRLPAWR